ncbi:hypothetical protein [Cellulomonas sp. URHD0024]|uniref:hypothetical protein n=1 Tax=Cellulomonas sp. URHD0024 TaxID=1302620 RepID=UPI00040FF1FA|nr:hypothetical protein [Cellulomonas sp. URHD0024]
MSAAHEPGDGMTFTERNVWVFAIVSLVAFLAYVGVIVSRAQDVPIEGVDYIAPMLWSIGLAIVASIVGTIVVSIIWRDGGTKDQRDKEIDRIGEYTGQSFLVMGGLAGLILAMLEADWFWIANALYLGFVLSALLSSATKIGLYRRGLPTW